MINIDDSNSVHRNLSGSFRDEIRVEIQSFFHEQVSNWELARKFYESLSLVRVKSFSYGDFEVTVQFNPARIVSSGAKMDAKTIAERPCFLCATNRPNEQKAIDFGDYEILVNPFPIFPEHFTIPRKEHIDQQIKPYFEDMLQLAKALDNYLIFYNGPKCGASAPDHMHFQAGTKDFLPLINDYKRLKNTHTDLLVTTEKMQLYQMKNYLRTVYCIESTDIESARDSFEKLYNHFSPLFLPSPQGEGVGLGVVGEVEPLMNVVCSFENDKWFVFVLPRKTFRPWQYTAEGDQQLMISPATVEMCGIFITPIESHFERITKEDVTSILEQVTF